jgi:hypothetical protein
VDNSVFCSGGSVVVLVTEHVFLFRIKDLHACSDVPVFWQGCAEKRKNAGRTSFGASAKSLRLSIPSIFTGTEQSTIYSIFNIKKKEKTRFYAASQPKLFVPQHRKKPEQATTECGFSALFCSGTPKPLGTKNPNISLDLYVK